jgi:hypothetical protein
MLTPRPRRAFTPRENADTTACRVNIIVSTHESRALLTNSSHFLTLHL